ncbi:hypothetical protein ACVWYO_001916 [Sphingomonas sp. UYP23]
MERKDWNRVALTAAVVLVPGGFLLGAALAARRLRERVRDKPEVAPDEPLEGNAAGDEKSCVRVTGEAGGAPPWSADPAAARLGTPA